MLFYWLLLFDMTLCGELWNYLGNFVFCKLGNCMALQYSAFAALEMEISLDLLWTSNEIIFAFIAISGRIILGKCQQLLILKMWLTQNITLISLLVKLKALEAVSFIELWICGIEYHTALYKNRQVQISSKQIVLVNRFRLARFILARLR